MINPGEFNTQLSDLTVKLTGMVAERLAYWTKDMESAEQRRQVLDMIESQLPTVISNAVAKSPSLHSETGVRYFEENLDNWADTWAKKFIGRD
jgi:hypothetical protein